MFLVVTLVINGSPGFCVIRVIPIFLLVLPLLFNRPKVSSGLKLHLALDCNNHLIACT